MNPLSVTSYVHCSSCSLSQSVQTGSGFDAASYSRDTGRSSPRIKLPMHEAGHSAEYSAKVNTHMLYVPYRALYYNVKGNKHNAQLIHTNVKSLLDCHTAHTHYYPVLTWPSRGTHTLLPSPYLTITWHTHYYPVLTWLPHGTHTLLPCPYLTVTRHTHTLLPCPYLTVIWHTHTITQPLLDCHTTHTLLPCPYLTVTRHTHTITLSLLDCHTTHTLLPCPYLTVTRHTHTITQDNFKPFDNFLT
jgi:hypothetical protein